MNQTVRKVAITAAVTLVTATMVAPAAVAHDRDGYRGGDRYGSRYDGHGDRDGYHRDGNSDRRHGDHDNYGGRDGSTATATRAEARGGTVVASNRGVAGPRRPAVPFRSETTPITSGPALTERTSRR